MVVLINTGGSQGFYPDESVELDTVSLASIESQEAAIQYGFTQVPNAFLRDTELSGQAFRVYCILLQHAWGSMREITRTLGRKQETLAQEVGMSVMTVSRALQELEERGWITSTRRGLGKCNIYTLYLSRRLHESISTLP